MPAFPDVEGFRRVLAAHTRAEIRRVDVLDGQVLCGVSGRRLDDALRGHHFTAPRRLGKFLVGPLDGGSAVLFHFGMTGELRWARGGDRHPHDRVVFVLPGGELRFRDMRKLQRIRFAADDDEVARMLADEILWRARIHPHRKGSDLSTEDVRWLRARMRTVLDAATPTGRVPPRKSWPTGRRDEPAGSCPHCGTTLRHGRAGGRGTVWCPSCQPE